MQPFGCMRASKDGGCSLLLDPTWRSPGRRPLISGLPEIRIKGAQVGQGRLAMARPAKRPGEHLRVTAKVICLGQ